MYIRVRSVYIRVQRDPLTHHMFIDARAELPTRTDNRWPFPFQEIRLYFPRNLSGQQAFFLDCQRSLSTRSSIEKRVLWSFFLNIILVCYCF
jgi:hypothetical protein